MSNVLISSHNTKTVKLFENVYRKADGSTDFTTLNIEVIDDTGEKLQLCLFHRPESPENRLKLFVQYPELVEFPQKELDDGTPA